MSIMNIDLSKAYKVDNTVEIRIDPASLEGVKLTQLYQSGERAKMSNPDFPGEYVVCDSFSEAYPEKVVSCFVLRLVGA